MPVLDAENEVVDIVNNAIESGEIATSGKLYKHTFTINKEWSLIDINYLNSSITWENSVTSSHNFNIKVVSKTNSKYTNIKKVKDDLDNVIAIFIDDSIYQVNFDSSNNLLIKSLRNMTTTRILLQYVYFTYSLNISDTVTEL